ncbi:MAG: nitric oxide reductase activation protein NorD [bacterium]
MPDTDALERKLDRHGFSLKSVCWGYREIFAESIRQMFESGMIGDDKKQVTESFFGLLNKADQSCYDHVLKSFLASMNPRNRWLLDLPGIFSDIVEMGAAFADSKLHYGVIYFDTLSRGGFGDSPDQMRRLMNHLRNLRETSEDLAIHFLKGYQYLCSRLRPHEIELYIRVGLEIFRRNAKNGCAFLEGTLSSSETYIQTITRESRLENISNKLTATLQALTGRKMEIKTLSELDADDLIERGTTIVGMYQWLYMPVSIREFDVARRNEEWYLLATICAAGLMEARSFNMVHGHEAYPTCEAVAGGALWRQNLFVVLEYARGLRLIRKRWPGARRLLQFGLDHEKQNRPPATDAERLFFDLAGAEQPTDSPPGRLQQIADGCVNFFDTAQRLDAIWAEDLRREYSGLGHAGIRPFAFLPDFLFPASVGQAPDDSLIANLKDQADKNLQAEEKDDEATDQSQEGQSESEGHDEDETDEAARDIKVCYLYDEWRQEEGQYYPDFCHLYEENLRPGNEAAIPSDVMEEARKVSQVFERIRPDLVRRERYLDEGEIINQDLLVDYMVQKKKEPAPPIRFYEKPRINQRDLAVLILLDASGSTGESLDARHKIMDMEKHAALILGQGLHTLGDRFSICGFNTNGNEDCHYYIYKDFEEDWNRESIGRILAAYPANSTRIGPALRHSGYRLARTESRQRLIILVTDGRPMDSGYDPNTRVAQHDVRMACEENERQYIHTFGISTEDNSLADMEIMFPGRRFTILPDIRKLPQVLPKLYTRLTV